MRAALLCSLLAFASITHGDPDGLSPEPSSAREQWYAVHPVQPAAERLEQSLAMLGNLPDLHLVPGPGGRHALLLGPYRDAAEAATAAGEWNRRGIPVFELARTTTAEATPAYVRWRLLLGDPMESGEARALADRGVVRAIAKPGFVPCDEGRVQVALTFTNPMEAEAALRTLAELDQGMAVTMYSVTEDLFAPDGPAEGSPVPAARRRGAAPAPPGDAPPPPPDFSAPAPPPDDRVFLSLEGGGEIVGRVAKETAEALFVDIGPEIIRVPLASVLRRSGLAELQPGEALAAGISSARGVFDPSTGSVVFTASRAAADTRTRAQILDDAKRGIVIVSNVRGRGSGWVLDNEGRIVTNHHVIGNERTQTVTLFLKRGDQWERLRIDDCEVEAFSSYYDIAIVRIPRERLAREGIELFPLEIAPAGELEPGDTVFAVGNPGMGGRLLEHTISEGVVSSLARNFSDVLYIQTTAPVNPGNSGGPLLDTRGRVVGLITSKATFAEGIAFALPVPLIRNFLDNRQAFAATERNQNRGFRYLPPE